MNIDPLLSLNIVGLSGMSDGEREDRLVPDSEIFFSRPDFEMDSLRLTDDMDGEEGIELAGVREA